MKLSQINDINFNGGHVRLKNVNAKRIFSYDSIKKFAEDRDIDIFISQSESSKNFQYKKIYTIIAAKNIYKQTGKLDRKIRAAVSAIVDKNTCLQETSVKIYNAAMSAMENLGKMAV